jgi:hypothetical protein
MTEVADVDDRCTFQEWGIHSITYQGCSSLPFRRMSDVGGNSRCPLLLTCVPYSTFEVNEIEIKQSPKLCYFEN